MGMLEAIKAAEDALIRGAKQNVESRGSTIAAAIIITDDEGHHFCGLIFRNNAEKVNVYHQLKMMAKRLESKRVVTINDAWWVKEKEVSGVRPSESPHRKEALVMTTITPEKRQMRHYPYERQGDKIIWLEPSFNENFEDYINPMSDP